MKKIIYIWLVKVFSIIQKVKTPQDIVYLMSFSGNENFILKLATVAKKQGIKFTVLYLPKCRTQAQELAKQGINVFEFDNNFDFIFHKLKIVLNSKLLICDNYFAFLSGINFDHQKTHIVQIWHANGAIKAFGWEEPKTLTRSKCDQRRFQRVYDQFDEFIVGSAKMGTVFEQSYHVPENKISVLGYPRTDELFNSDWQSEKKKQIYVKYPQLKNKEILLYAPTYREDSMGRAMLKLPDDFDDLSKALNNDQCLIVKIHPHLAQLIQQLKSQIKNANVIWVDDFSTNDLLLITDRLITDYSSMIFDYTLLPNAKEIIFYCFDYDQYAKEIGIQKDFLEWIPGKLVKSTQELINSIEDPIKKEDFAKFNAIWNTKNDGNATKRVIYKEMKYLKA